MLRPSYAELMDILDKNSEDEVSSRYTVVIAAAKRARQLVDGDDSMLGEEEYENKPLSVAIEEMRRGKISVVPEGEGTRVRPKMTEEEAEIKKELSKKAPVTRPGPKENPPASSFYTKPDPYTESLDDYDDDDDEYDDDYIDDSDFMVEDDDYYYDEFDDDFDDDDYDDDFDDEDEEEFADVPDADYSEDK